MTSPIQRYQPKNGRHLRESGELFNIADFFAWNQDYNPTYNTAFNGALIASKTILGIDQDDYYLGLSVPSGKRVILFDRTLKINNGSFTISVQSGTFSGGTQLLSVPLRSNANLEFDSTFRYDVTPDPGAVTVQETLVIAATDSGSKAATGALEKEGYVKVFVGPASAILEIHRNGASGPYDLGIEYIALEEGASSILLEENTLLTDDTEMSLYG